MEATDFQDIEQFIEPLEDWRNRFKFELLERIPKTIELPHAASSPQSHCAKSLNSQSLTPQKQKAKVTTPDSKMHSVWTCPFLKLVLQ